MDLFSSLILNEALPQQQLNTNTKQKIKAPPTQPPPDLTKNTAANQQKQQQNIPNIQQQQPQMNTQQQQQDTNMDAMGGDMNDPSLSGGEDPTQQQDDGAGEEQQGNDLEDPTQQGDDGGDELQSPQDPSEVDPKEKEQELFASLKPEQLELKQEELKRQFKNLYDSVNGSLEKLKKVSHTSQDDHLLDFLVRKLLDVRDISRDYLVKTFDTKSYVENQIQLQRLISVFSMVTTLVSNVYLARVKREIASEKKMNVRNKPSNRSTFYGLANFEKGIDVQ